MSELFMQGKKRDHKEIFEKRSERNLKFKNEMIKG